MLIDFRQLFPRWNIKPTGVLHVGANVGEEAPVYDELGIKNVVWVEANPDTFNKLVANVFKYNHRTWCFCAGNKNQKAVLHVSNNGSQSSSVLDLGTHKIAHPEVEYVQDVEVAMVRIENISAPVNSVTDNYYSLKGIDFLNMDIQGYELEALKGMDTLLRQFKWAYLEVNQAELYKGCPHVNDLDLFMTGFHFERVETRWCGNTGWGDALYIRR